MAEWPRYMQIWLHSVHHNPSVTFTMLTNLNASHTSWKDNMDDMDMPPNIKLVHTNYTAVVTLARRLGLFDFRLKATAPYKLCDFRPLLGVMYPELLNGYSHW